MPAGERRHSGQLGLSLNQAERQSRPKTWLQGRRTGWSGSQEVLWGREWRESWEGVGCLSEGSCRHMGQEGWEGVQEDSVWRLSWRVSLDILEVGFVER